MKLPISNAGGLRSSEGLVRATGRATIALGQSVADQTTTDTATCFTNPDRPAVRCANFAADLALGHDIDADDTLDQITAHFADRGVRCHSMHCAEGVWPRPVADALASRNYHPVTRHVMLLKSFAPPRQTHQSLQIIPARAAYQELRRFYVLMARRDYSADNPLAEDLANTFIDQLDEARLDLFLGRLERRPVAVAGVLSLGQVGVINPAYCDSQFRGQGIAAALVNHVLEHCQRAMFSQVIVDRAEGCPAIPFYESLGFKLAGSYQRYRFKTVA